jgi:hypothetical protein
MAKKAYVYTGSAWVDLASSTLDLSGYAPLAVTTNAQTGTTYTLVLADNGKYVEMNNASANTLTVPLNSSVPFPVGSQITVIQTGTGATTIDQDSGVTITYFTATSSGTKTLKGQWTAATLIKRATNTWVLIGNLT